MDSTPIFYINLDSETERRCAIEAIVLRSGLPSLRIPGVSISINSQRDYLVGTAVAGCWQSHLRVYKQVLEHDFKISIVLEDDAKVTSKILKRIDVASLELVKHEIDILQFGYLYNNFREYISLILSDLKWVCEIHSITVLNKILKKIRFLNFSSRIRVQRALFSYNLSKRLGLGYLRPDNFLPGTHAYVISNKFASKAIKFNSDPQLFSADLFYMSLSKMASFQIWRTCFSRIGQDSSFASSITGNRFLNYGTRDIS